MKIMKHFTRLPNILFPDISLIAVNRPHHNAYPIHFHSTDTYGLRLSIANRRTNAYKQSVRLWCFYTTNRHVIISHFIFDRQPKLLPLGKCPY